MTLLAILCVLIHYNIQQVEGTELYQDSFDAILFKQVPIEKAKNELSLYETSSIQCLHLQYPSQYLQNVKNAQFKWNKSFIVVCPFRSFIEFFLFPQDRMRYEIVKRLFDNIPKLFTDLVLLQNNLLSMNRKELAWDWFKQPFQILSQLWTILLFQNSWFQDCGSYLHCWVQVNSLFDDAQQPYCSLSQNSMQLRYFYGMLPLRDSSQLLLKSVLFSSYHHLTFLKLCLCDDKIHSLLLFLILYHKIKPTISIFSSGAEHHKQKDIFELLLAFIRLNEELIQTFSIFAFVLF